MAPSREIRFNLRPTPLVIALLIVFVAVYIVTAIALRTGGEQAAGVVQLFPLQPGFVVTGQVWRLVTYALLHSPDDPMHLIMNGVTLFFFGPDLERRFGRLRFGAFFAGASIVGGLFVVAAYLLFHMDVVVLGCSAAGQACVVLWALLHRDAQMFPLPIRGIHMLWLALAWWVLDAVSLSSTSATAHLGGIVFGLVAWRVGDVGTRKKLFGKLRPKKKSPFTVVPKPDRWVN
jgi:uncharacterized protein